MKNIIWKEKNKKRKEKKNNKTICLFTTPLLWILQCSSFLMWFIISIEALNSFIGYIFGPMNFEML